MIELSRVRRMPICYVSEFFLEWLRDIIYPCAYVHPSCEVKRMHPHGHLGSKAGRVAAADDNQFHVLFVRGTQEDKYDPTCSSLLDDCLLTSISRKAFSLCCQTSIVAM
jgi:hypothetical protein